MRFSLRARLVALTVLLLAVGLTLSNTALILALRGPLVERVDAELRPLSQLVSHLPPTLFATLRDRLPATAAVPEDDLVTEVYIAYLRPDGSIEASAGSSGPDISDIPSPGTPVELGGWRVFVTPRADPAQGSVLVAASLSAVDETVGEMRTRALLIGAGVLAVLAVLGWFAVRAGLRPLRRIEHTAADIARGELSHRVPMTAGPSTEVGRLTLALNGMLSQIEAGFAVRAHSEERMRRFVADVSHELRTPLASIRGFSELYRMGALPEPADVDRTMARIDSEAARMASLVEDLLLLAQLDEALPLQREELDLRILAADAIHDLRALAPDRPTSLTGPDGGPIGAARVYADEARLRQVMTNLVGNAIRHTPPEGAIRIGVGTVDDHAVIEVADTGPGMSAEEAAQVFDRFYRADTSRSRATGGGAGLGLSIVASLVSAHGGRIEVDTAPNAGATFRVILDSSG